MLRMLFVSPGVEEISIFFGFPWGPQEANFPQSLSFRRLSFKFFGFFESGPHPPSREVSPTTISRFYIFGHFYDPRFRPNFQFFTIFTRPSGGGFSMMSRVPGVAVKKLLHFLNLGGLHFRTKYRLRKCGDFPFVPIFATRGRASF